MYAAGRFGTFVYIVGCTAFGACLHCCLPNGVSPLGLDVLARFVAPPPAAIACPYLIDRFLPLPRLRARIALRLVLVPYLEPHRLITDAPCSVPLRSHLRLVGTAAACLGG